jgi:hypothetical protein
VKLVDALTAAAKQPPDALFTATKVKVPILFDTSGLAADPRALLSYGADISDYFDEPLPSWTRTWFGASLSIL